MHGPARAVCPVCVNVSCVGTITVALNDFLPRYLARWFILTVYRRSISKVKVVGQSHVRSQENVDKVVSASSR